MEYYYDSVTKIDADEILKSLTLLACNPGGLEAVGAATLLALKSIAGGGVIPLKALDKLADMMELEDRTEAFKIIQKLLNFDLLREYDTGYYMPDAVRISLGPICERSVARTQDRKKEKRDQRLLKFEHGLMSTWDQELGEGEI